MIGTGRTLLIAYDLPPAPNAAARRLEFMVGQAARVFGDGLTVVAPSGSHPPPGVHLDTFRAELPSATSGALLRLAREGRIAAELIRRVRAGGFERVIVSSPLFVPTLLVTFYLRNRGVPYLLDIRDPYPDVFVEAGLVTQGGMIHRTLVRATTAMYRGAAMVSCATKSLAAEVRRVSPGTPVRTMRNGHNGCSILSDSRSETDFTISCHGNFGAFQDVEVISDFLQRMLCLSCRVRVVLVGRGRGRAMLEERLAAEVASGRVEIRSAVSPSEITDSISQTDLGLSVRGDDEISRSAFPVRITDYLELGVPVLVTPHSEAGRIVERLGVGASFAGSEVDEMVAFASSLIERGVAYEALRQRALAWRDCFARDRTMRRFRSYLVQSFE